MILKPPGIASTVHGAGKRLIGGRRPLSKPMPSDCDEEENRRGEGSKPNYDSPDKRSLFFFAVIAMNMPQHLNLSHQVQSDIRYDPDYPSYKLTSLTTTTKPTSDGALSK